MDLWVVAAAAGAGYIAKNLQNLSVDNRESLGGPSFKSSYNVQSESRNFLQQLRDKTCPLRRLERQRVQDNAFLDVENQSDANFSEIERLSSRDREDGVAFISGDALDGENRNLSRANRGGLVRNRRCRVHSMRAVNALGGCVENMEHSTCLCPSISTMRPVLVTDGMWGNNSSFTEFDGYRDEARRENIVCSSSSSSKQSESVEEMRKPKKSISNLQLSGSRDTRSSRSQGNGTMLLFITGMTIGILSATTPWKNEVDKLNKQLKQMENLVQDLHEELDMKEMLMVKELTEEGDLPSEEKDTPLLIQEPISSPDGNVDKLNKFDSVKKNEKNAENLELLSRIEAELQAELEMLEQNMKASAVERISSVVESDPDFEPEIVQGDLKATMVNDASESGNETTDTMTNSSKPANYAVSPRELSLRLHELIESRLETRIKELEIALGNSQNMVSGRRFSYSETESSSTHQSPTCICDEHDKREVSSTANFSSNYVNAYKDRNSGSKAVDQGKCSIDRMQNEEYDSISHHGVIMEEDGSETLVHDMPQIWDKQRSTSFTYNEDSMSEDEGSDESEMLLIKQIVERRRSCSSLNLKID